MRIHDISQPLGTKTAVWPGDRPVEVPWNARREDGSSVNVAALLTSVHAGTHIDGFLHFEDGGATAAEMPLDAYVGRCVVVDVRGRDVIDADALDGVDVRRTPRVLFRTRDRVDATTFPQPFAPLSVALARRLVDAGVPLVGTDAPSVDAFDSKTLDTHHALAAGRIAILESVVLDGIEPGEYTLVALPLRLVEADSSPVRAVLIEGELA